MEGSWHYLWIHRRMPGGNVGVFTEGCQEGTKNTSDWHLRESLRHDKILSSLISAFYTLADSELIPSETEPISMSNHWENKYFVL